MRNMLACKGHNQKKTQAPNCR